MGGGHLVWFSVTFAECCQKLLLFLDGVGMVYEEV